MGATDRIKSFVKNLPPVRKLVEERDALVKAHGIAPPGHFYSPVVSADELARDAGRIFAPHGREVPGIDMNEAEQLTLLSVFETLYPSIPFQPHKTAGARYHYENPAYSYSDAIVLHCMIRHLAPQRIVEIGSGYSSAAMLDTNERFFADRIATTFVEPYPQLLQSLLRPGDAERVTIVPQRLQDVDIGVFTALQAGDILFVDSTHVSKAGSDVNRVLFEILPAVARGVHIHVHDVFYPFEYPREWLVGGRSWNEIYALRAFLQFNSAFRIVFMNTFLEEFHEARFAERMPLALKNRGGSIWLRKA